MKTITVFSLLSSLLLPSFSSGAPPPVRDVVIVEVLGRAERYDDSLRAFAPVAPGFVVDKPTLFVTDATGSLVFSCVGSIAGKLSGNSRVVLAPAVGDLYEADLRRGSMAVLLDPDRPKDSPRFSIRTAQGVTAAKGTFFAVAEYNGQTYGKAKKGTVKRKVTPPGQPDFAAYLSKSKSKPAPPKPPKKN